MNNLAAVRGTTPRYRSGILPVLVCGVLLRPADVPTARAEGPIPSVHDHSSVQPAGVDEPVLGCGKARAALRRFSRPIEGERTPGDIAYAAAMPNTDVLHYDLDIEVSNFNPGANTCLLSGTNRMTVESRSAGLAQFLFRLRDNFTITDAMLNDTLPVSVDVLSPSTRRVTLDHAYGVGEVFTLTVAYTGPTDSGGMGSIDVDSQPNGAPTVATLSEPYFAYSWWPVKDGDVWLPGDNSDKSTIAFSVTIPSSMTVASNGLLLGIDRLSGERRRFHWDTNYPIAPYLVSFSAAQYNTWTEQYDYAGGQMPVEFYVYPSWDSPSNRSGWNRSVDMLGVYAQVFGEYPFIQEKYGIYNFLFGGGMEHQTITGQGGFSEALTAHELGHQWFGDAITCTTWSDIWLNEGFAEYTECIWEEFKSGSQNKASYLNAVRARKPGVTNWTVYVPPADTSSVSRIFNYTTTYLKGAWVLHQLRHVVGEEAFFDFLIYYRTMYEGSALDTAEFIATANTFFGQDLNWFFSQWLYEGGMPSYRYGWNSVDVDGQNYLRVHIEQFQQTGPPVFTMPIDLHVQTTTGPTILTVWSDAALEWFVLPVGGTPLSVALDPEDWVLHQFVQQVSYVPGPPKIVDVYPPAGGWAAVEDAISEVRITLQEPVNVTSSDVQLVGLDRGPVGFTMTSGSPTGTIVLHMTQPLTRDLYTLTVFDTVVATASGMALDGEIAAGAASPLPSGDGTPGGTAEITFRILNVIPTTSTWGFAVLLLALLAAGSVLLRRIRRPA